MKRRRESGQVDGRVVVITGAARGIGAATARVLAARGARLALVGLEPDALAALAADLGSGHIWLEADVTDQAAVDAAVASTVRQLGGIDVLIANAGVVNYGTVRTAGAAAFARTVDVNLTGVYRTVAAAAPHLAVRRGYVLVVASVASFVPLVGAGGYAASKAGVASLTATLRAELAVDKVMVGSAHPSWIDTDMVRSAEVALPAFKQLRAGLPWPARSVTSVEQCARSLADAVERRARRVYVPRSVAVVSVLQPLLHSVVAETAARRGIAKFIRQLDAEVTDADNGNR